MAIGKVNYTASIKILPLQSLNLFNLKEETEYVTPRSATASYIIEIMVKLPA